jgi:hypothetical protein
MRSSRTCLPHRLNGSCTYRSLLTFACCSRAPASVVHSWPQLILQPQNTSLLFTFLAKKCYCNMPANRSAIPLPPSDYPLWDSLPAEVVEQGKLSQLQLEGVLYACTRHQQILPSGQRAGFFIGVNGSSFAEMFY